MQIVVLGNGFDKASGLPTLYQEFFDWRINEIEYDIEILFSKYEKMLMQPVNLKHTENGLIHELTITYDSKEYSYHTIWQELREVLKELSIKGINYFDLYFYIKKKNANKFENWFNVEDEIKK